MRIRLFVFALLTTSALCGEANAQSGAPDRCRDILVDGTMQSEKFRESNSFMQIVWSRFMRSTYESSKSDRSLGGSIPVGEIVLGANYSEETYNMKKSQMKSEYFNQINSSREIDVALASGDPTIVNQWALCMQRSGGGTTVRFEPLNDTEAFVIIEYRIQGRNYKEKLIGNVPLPQGITVTDPARCFRKNTFIEAGRECRATIKLPSATTTLAITVPGRESVAQAWLPARLKLVRETKPYSFSAADRLERTFHKMILPVSHTVSLPAEQIAAGWLFDPSTAQTNLQALALHRRAECREPVTKATAHTFSYGYTGWAPDRTRPGNDGQATCAVAPFILMKRDVWTAGDATMTIVPAPLG